MGERFEKIWAAISPRPLIKLAASIDDNGMLNRTANPPTTDPSSSITFPISVTTAMEFEAVTTMTRQRIMAIPAFRRAAMLIVGAASVPYHAYDKDRNPVSNAFLAQPESQIGYTRSVTYANIAMDILFDRRSLLRITDFYSDGTPRFGRHVPSTLWDQDPVTGTVFMDGGKVPDREVRLFYGPFPGWVECAGPTVLMAEKIRARTARFLDKPQAREYLQSDGSIPRDENDVQELLANWEDYRKEGVTAFLPDDLTLSTVDQMTPQDMMLKDVFESVIAEACRISGVDASWNFLNITTRQYSNIIDERRNLIDLVAMPSIIKPMEERFSMDDVVPHGQYVKANLDSFLRAYTKDRYETYALGISGGWLTTDEARNLEDRPDLDEGSE